MVAGDGIAVSERRKWEDYVPLLFAASEFDQGKPGFPLWDKHVGGSERIFGPFRFSGVPHYDFRWVNDGGWATGMQSNTANVAYHLGEDTKPGGCALAQCRFLTCWEKGGVSDIPRS